MSELFKMLGMKPGTATTPQEPFQTPATWDEKEQQLRKLKFAQRRVKREDGTVEGSVVRNQQLVSSLDSRKLVSYAFDVDQVGSNVWTTEERAMTKVEIDTAK